MKDSTRTSTYVTDIRNMLAKAGLDTRIALFIDQDGKVEGHASNVVSIGVPLGEVEGVYCIKECECIDHALAGLRTHIDKDERNPRAGWMR